MESSEQTSSGRTKREKSNKSNRLLALERLKNLKGSKNKYEVDNLENVYEEVDEKEYTETVLSRQNDDWIVDDGESGYVEDGRDIFDDDLDEESIQKAMKNKITGPRKRRKDETKKKRDIQSMILNMPSKKSKNENIQDDDILGDLMSELKDAKQTSKSITKTNVRNKFCVTLNTTKENSESETLIKDRSKFPSEETSSNIDINISDDDEPMFDKPDILNVKDNLESTENQSISQNIEEIKSQNNEFHLSTEMLNDCLSKPSSSKMVEENYDFSQDFEDLTDADFKNVDKNKLKVIDKEEQEETIDSEMFSQWDHDLVKQTNDTTLKVVNTEIPIPYKTDANGEKLFRFYWLDAFEDSYKQPGTIHLFGKVYVESIKEYCSCCLTVKNIPRRIFLLPRPYLKKKGNKGEAEEPTTMADVYKEFNDYANKNRIKEFRSAKVEKNYAFEQENVPKKAEYLEVRYSANYPAMDPDFSGSAIERVFGTSVNALELFLIERKIKGPCWLDVKDTLLNDAPISWCKLKIICPKMENISIYTESKSLSVPPLVIATVNSRIAYSPKSRQNEVVMVAVLFHNQYYIDKEPPKPYFQKHFCLVTHPKESPWTRQIRDALPKITYTKIIKCDKEVELLEELLNIIHKTDPDLIISNDCGFQLDILIDRMFTLKVSNWSRIGRLKRTNFPKRTGKFNLGNILVGRPLCDIQVSARELNLKVRSYDLPSLCVEVLKKKENEYKEINISDTIKFYTTIEKIENLIQHTLSEASYILSIMFELNVIPLALQITCIAGNILSRTLSAGRAERNEYLLLHAFHMKNYITPDKRTSKKTNDGKKENNPRRKKPAYAGGLVLDPKKGFYDTFILLMDFNSLYPSIIQEYNLCFSTVPGAAYAEIEDLAIPDPTLEPGIIPTEIRELVERRVQIKTLMKTPNITLEQKMQYNIRQMALKLTANSMYGCLGAVHCRFYAKGLAALVTSKGREILQNTKHLVEKLNYEVIYGDTDSIMINTNILNYEEVFAIGKKIKQEVNKLYKRVELDIDGVFRYLLLLKKKKYAAVTASKLPSGKIELNQELKGLDIVRRDWCQLACDIGKKILDQLFYDQSHETRLSQVFDILKNVALSIRENQTPLSTLVITKQLSKNPTEYSNPNQSHVLVALRLNKNSGRMWKSGDFVPYVICLDGSDKSAIERAYHIDEFKKSDDLKIDVDYYLKMQILPITLRITEPIQGVDEILIADALGIKGVYQPKRSVRENEDSAIPIFLNEEKFKYCIPLTFKCRNESCQSEIVIKDLFTTTPTGRQFSLALCVNPDCKTAPWTYANYIHNVLQLSIRKFISDYYSGGLECENPECSYKIHQLPCDYIDKHPPCAECNDSSMHLVYSEMSLHLQLNYYKWLFDINLIEHKQLVSQCSRQMIAAYDTLRELVEKYLSRNGYGVVDLNKLFATHHTYQEWHRPRSIDESEQENEDNTIILSD